MSDVFRPFHEPARSIYDAFQAEAKNRPGRTTEEWTKAEREAVWRAARDAAQQLGLKVLPMEAVERAERYACGSVDYGSKWAYRVAEAMKEPDHAK